MTTYLPTDSENRPGGRVSRSHRAGLRHSACLSAPSFPRLEGGHGAILVPLILWLDFRLGDTPVDLHRRFLPHLVSNMGVGVQRGGAGHMAQDGGQRLNVHSVGQGVGGEGMPQIVEPDPLTSGVIQDPVQAQVDGRRAHRRVLFLGRREHPSGIHSGLVLPHLFTAL